MSVCAWPLLCVSVGACVCSCLFVCMWVFFLWKGFPCCLGLVCAGAILSHSRDCNEQLAAHQALTGTWFPREISGPMCVCVCAGGCSLVLGNARTELGGGWNSHYCALCKLTALAPAGKACSILQHQSVIQILPSSLIGHSCPQSLYCPC